MTKTWLDRLCEPLEHPKYKQISHALIKRDIDGNIIGKCAEGEIACQNNLKVDYEREVTLRTEHFQSLGIPLDLLGNTFPLLDWNNDFMMEREIASIGGYIVTMNDNGFTYPQIVEFLRTTFEDAV